MIARLILGYMLADLAFVRYLTRAVGKGHSHKLAILDTAASRLGEMLKIQNRHVFWDTHSDHHPR